MNKMKQNKKLNETKLFFSYFSSIKINCIIVMALALNFVISLLIIPLYIITFFNKK